MSELFPLDPWILAVTFLVTAASAALQGTIGFGFAVVAVPVLSLLDPSLAPVPQLLVSAPLTLSMLWRERHAIDLRGATWVLIGRLPGAVLGLALLELASARALDLLMGAFVLMGVAILATGVHLPRNRTTELTAGIVSGVTSLVASIGGPPLALLYRDEKGETLRATLAALFSIGLVITILARALSGNISERDVVLSAWMLPPLLLGVWASRYLLSRVEGRPLRIGVLVVSAAAALGLVARAVL